MRERRVAPRICSTDDILTAVGSSAHRDLVRSWKSRSALKDASSTYPRYSIYSRSDSGISSRAAALATDCEVEVNADPKNSMTELRQNKVLGTNLPIHLIFRNKPAHHSLQGKHSNKSSTPSMEWSIECTVSLRRRQISWVSHTMPRTSMHTTSWLTDVHFHQGNVTYGELGSGVTSSGRF